MSGTPIGSPPPRKSFAQVNTDERREAKSRELTIAKVAAAANRPAVPKQNPTNTSPAQERVEERGPRLVQPTAPRIALPPRLPTGILTDQPHAVTPSRTAHSSAEAITHTLQATSLGGTVASGDVLAEKTLKKDNSDTKSVASRTTLTLDEKESLRPDDSASMQAAVEEDTFSPASSVVASSKPGSDHDARAFREQLDQIGLNGNGRVIMPRAQRPERIGEHETRGIIFPPPPVESTALSSHPVEEGLPRATPPAMWIVPPDPKLCEALESPKDRLFVLKVEQDLIDFVKDPREEFLQLPGTNSFYRMLSHKLADYYMLGHVVDDTMSSVRIYRTPHTRLPAPLINSTPRTNDNTPPPTATTRQIMRRNGAGRTSSRRVAADGTIDSMSSSKATSDVGSGSDDRKDGKSGDRAALTREERESRYKEARARIFKDFEGKEPVEAANGDKGLSRSSSTSGAKKNKKQRKPKDDAFEARSAFDALGRRISDNGFSQTSTEAAPFDQYYFDQGQLVSNAQSFAPSQTFPIGGFGPPNGHHAGSMNQQWQPQDMPMAGLQYLMSPPTYSQDGYSTLNGGYDGNTFSPNMALDRTPKGTASTLSNIGQGYTQPPQMGWSQEGVMNGYSPPEYQYQDMNTNYSSFYNNQIMQQPMSPNGLSTFPPQQTPPNYNQAYYPPNFEPGSFDPQSRSFIPSMRTTSSPQYQMGPFQTAQNGYTMQRQPSYNEHVYPGNFTLNSPPPQVQTDNHYRRPSSSARSKNQGQTQAGSNANARMQAQAPFQPSSISKWAAPANLPAKPPVPSVVSGKQQLPPKPVATR